MKPLVSYLRVSSDKQGVRGLGMEAQRAAIARYAESAGVQVVAEYVEVESGRVKDRPELRKAVAQARLNGCVLCVAKLDRLSRNLAFVVAILESGVDFCAVDMPHANRFMLHILAAVAEYEAQMISERTKAALAAYKARGGKLGAHRLESRNLTMEGMRRGIERIQADAREYASRMRPTLALLRQSGMTLQEIADRLNGEGRLTRRGKRWYPATVLAVLKAG